tara:strand:+ start:1435 stop:3681 length:2247 start_codon:yes stop_codon:yes gene_type:complete
MATTETNITSTGATSYSFTFEYLKTTDIKVSVNGTASTQFTVPSATTVQFNAGHIPASGAAIRIYRDTNSDQLSSNFYAGSAIKASDLNDNFEQNLFVTQEAKRDAASAWQTGDETIISTETWVGDNSKVGTTGAIDARIDSKIDTALTTDVAAGNKITVTDNSPGSGQITVALTSGSIVDSDVNASAAIAGSKLQASSGSNAGSMSSANFTKLAGIETSATADQTAAEIRTLVESATDSNVFTDADHTKLNGIDDGAKNDQTGPEILSLLESNNISATHIAADAVSVSKIQNPELKELATMPNATAHILADSTALTATTAEINAICDGKAVQTTITNDDTKYPTSGAVVDYVAANTGTIADGSITGAKLNDPVELVDNKEIYWGTGNDFFIHWNSAHAILRAPNEADSSIKIQADTTQIQNRAEEQVIIKAWENSGDNDSGVELYGRKGTAPYAWVKKLHTNGSGVTISNEDFNVLESANITKNVNLIADSPDVNSGRLILGAGDDISVYHDATNSHITNATGYLSIQSASGVKIGDTNLAHLYVVGDSSDQSVELYFDDVKHFETTTGGVAVTGSSNTYAQTITNSHASDPDGLIIDFSADDPDGPDNFFIKCTDSTALRMQLDSAGDIWTSDDGVLTSDQTLKENIVDATSKLEDLSKIKVRNFNWKSSYHPEKSKKKMLGFIAQEVETVFPSLINEVNIETDPDATPVKKKAIKAAWDPILVKAVQELYDKVKVLEAEVAALKG